MGELGKIRRRRGGREFFLDFRPYGRVWSNRGIRITDEDTARRLLEQIRGRVADESKALDEVLAEYLPVHAKPNLAPRWLERWLEVKRGAVASKTLSPTYLRELERYAAPGGYFSFFDAASIHELTYGMLEDWAAWLGARGLSPKTQSNALGAFRSFVGWLRRRGEIRAIPEFPWPKVPEHLPRVLTLAEQDAILRQIPEPERGIFLALCDLGLRPGEARALEVGDAGDGWLTVSRACKGHGADAPIGPTKSGKTKRLPLSQELAEWIARHVDPSGRLTRAPLFVNPRTETRWGHWSLRDAWLRAARAIGLGGVKFYEATKHTMATAAIARGVNERVLQRVLGHADSRSTRRYAQLADSALIQVLRSPRVTPDAVSLSPACRQAEMAEEGSSQLPDFTGLTHAGVALPTGVEPVFWP